MFKVYIGSNNKTHQVEERKLKKVLNEYFEGYTILKAIGYWKGQKEESRIIEIETRKKAKILTAIKELKEVLQQEEIGLVEIKEALQFI